jgi:ATP-dependent DNA ligase
VTLTTRNANDWTNRFKEIAAALATLPCHNAILDGEAVHMAADGTMSFHALQNALSTGKKEDLQFWVFDLLLLDGEDVRDKPLLERKALLKELLENRPSASTSAIILMQAARKCFTNPVRPRWKASSRSGRTTPITVVAARAGSNPNASRNRSL